MLQPYQIFHFDTFCDPRGKLYVFESSAQFQIRRVFFISQVPPGATRGNHALKRSNEILVLTAGACRIDLYDGKTRRTVSMSTPSDALYVPKMTWLKLYDFSTDCVLTVLADQPYDRGEILDRFDTFLQATVNK